jgi:uncharacterized membrane protein
MITKIMMMIMVIIIIIIIIIVILCTYRVAKFAQNECTVTSRTIWAICKCDTVYEKQTVSDENGRVPHTYFIFCKP